jgi:hypothetical protein
VHLPTARLGLRELDLVAEPFQQPHRRPAHLRVQGVRKAGHEQGYPHGLTLLHRRSPVLVVSVAVPSVWAAAVAGRRSRHL